MGGRMEKALLLRLTHPELQMLRSILDERTRQRLFYGTGRSPVEISLHMQVNQLMETQNVPVS